jgi:hypothetical protein
MIPMLIKVVDNSDDSFCMFPSVRRGKSMHALPVNSTWWERE